MKKHVPSNKNGAILVIVMAVLVALSLMVVALLQLGSFNQIETVKQLRTTQAHWLAEAGLERGLSRIYGSDEYRAGYLTKNFSSDETLLGGIGSYKVEITKAPVSGTDRDEYTITSIGMVSNNAMVVTNAVQLKFRGGAGLQSTLMGLSNSFSKIAANVEVKGLIFQSGVLKIEPGAATELNGLVEATDGVTGNSGEATQGDLQDPDPGPRIKPSVLANYSSMTNYAASTNAGPYPAGTAVNLSGGINYYNGSATIDKNVTGSGTLVVSGDLIVAADIPANVNLVAGGIITLGNKAVLYGRNTVFTFYDIDFSGGDFQGPFVTLQAMGGIQIASGITTFKGIIYADGKYRHAAADKLYYGVIFKSGKQLIYGTIIAWKGFYLGSNATIIYDDSVFNNFDSFDYANGFTHQANSWQWAESPF